MNLPNLITLGRLISVPVAIWLILDDHLQGAFWLFIAAGVSDGIDGWIARHFNLHHGTERMKFAGRTDVSLVRELGFDAAVCTHWGAASAATDRFQIPRFTPWDQTRGRFGMRLLRSLAQPAPFQ